MKVKCRGYEGYLEEIEVTAKDIYGIAKSYRVYINIEGNFVDLRNVRLDEVKFVEEE